MLTLALAYLLQFVGALFTLVGLALQDAPTTALGILALTVAQAVIAWLSGKAYDGLKTIIPWWDERPAIYHQIAAPIFGLLFGFLTARLGIALITDLHGIDAAYVSAALTALVQAGIKRWEKSREPADATAVLLASRVRTSTVRGSHGA